MSRKKTIILIIIFFVTALSRPENLFATSAKPTRFRLVEEWVGTMTLQTMTTYGNSKSVSGTDIVGRPVSATQSDSWNNSSSAIAQTVRLGRAENSDTSLWSFTEGKAALNARYSSKSKGWRIRENTQGSGSRMSTRFQAQWSIDEEAGTYSVYFGGFEEVSVQVSGSSSSTIFQVDTHHWKVKREISDSNSVNYSRQEQIHELGLPGQKLPGSEEPLPSVGMSLQGSQTIQNQHPGEDGGVIIVTQTFSWSLSPANQVEPDLTVRVGETFEEYERWIPKGDKRPLVAGNTIRIDAQLTKRGQDEAYLRAEKIIFELVKTSKEKGVAMNWPEFPDGHSDPDFYFEPERNDRLSVDISSNFAQRAETKEGEVSSATAVLSSFDWGAHTFLKVTAIMPDGNRIQGSLEWNPAQSLIPIPKRQRDSRIADAWKMDHGAWGLKDDDDSENDPEGDGHRGDGLTLYEEYRGFYTTGDPYRSLDGHFYGHPRKKDVFIENKAGQKIIPIISMFARVTGLEVRILGPGEMAPDRAVNFNRTEGPQVVKQHGIRISFHPELEKHVGGMAVGGPGTPQKVSDVFISTKVDPDEVIRYPEAARSTFDSVVAHELLHAVNVWHHGDTDIRRVVWMAHREEGKVVIRERPFGQPFEAAYPVQVYHEGNGDMTAQLYFLINRNPYPRDFMRLYVANQQGEHSGDNDCLMRYEVASAYVPAHRPSSARIYSFSEHHRELIGNELCRQVVGTGVNDPHRNPWPRYGNADETKGRGHCRRQLCVNDLYADQHPERI